MKKMAYMRQGGGVETQASADMEKKNPYINMKKDKKAEVGGLESLRQEIEKRKALIGDEKDMPKMNCGGLMEPEGFEVIIGVDEASGNEIPAGSTAKEVTDDVPAMLSEGEYVVPADVVRWHGVKHLEKMRQEAKMGLGIMASDGRVSNHDSEESEEHEEAEEDTYYNKDIKEEDVEMVHAAKGTLVDSSGKSVRQPRFYRYVVVYDPETRRYAFLPVEQKYVEKDVVDEETGEVVTEDVVDETTGEVTQVAKKEVVLEQNLVTADTFEPEKAKRYSVEETLRQIYDEPIPGEEEAEEPKTGLEGASAMCPVGTVWNGMACILDVSSSSEEEQSNYRALFADSAQWKSAQEKGPLTSDDLKDQAGDTLSEKAIDRMFTPSENALGVKDVAMIAGSVLLGSIPFFSIYKGYQFYQDGVEAMRAAITRMDEQQKVAATAVEGLGAGETAELDDPMVAYNFVWDPNTASFIGSQASTAITSLGQDDRFISEDNKSGAVAAGYMERDKDGNYHDVSKIDWDTDGALIDDIMSQIELSMDSLGTATTSNDGRASRGEDSKERKVLLDSVTENPEATRITAQKEQLKAEKGKGEYEGLPELGEAEELIEARRGLASEVGAEAREGQQEQLNQYGETADFDQINELVESAVITQEQADSAIEVGTEKVAAASERAMEIAKQGFMDKVDEPFEGLMVDDSVIDAYRQEAQVAYEGIVNDAMKAAQAGNKAALDKLLAKGVLSAADVANANDALEAKIEADRKAEKARQEKLAADKAEAERKAAAARRNKKNYTAYVSGSGSGSGGGYYSVTTGGVTTSAGRATSSGTNSASTVSGGSGRSDGGYGWAEGGLMKPKDEDEDI